MALGGFGLGSWSWFVDLSWGVVVVVVVWPFDCVVLVYAEFLFLCMDLCCFAFTICVAHCGG